MITVFVLSIFIFLLPMTMYFTLSDRDFINYMGIGTYDVRVDISNIQGNEEQILNLIKKLHFDDEVKKMESFHSKWMDITLPSKEEQKIWMEFGDQTIFPIKYIEGKAPFEENEISLSKLNAQELSINVGDELQINYKGDDKNTKISKTVKVTGIFSDLTNGAKTSKANLIRKDAVSQSSLFEKDSIWIIGAIELKKGTSAHDFIKKYQKSFPFAKFADTKSYLNQIFGNTISMIKMSGIIAWIASIIVIFFIVLLFSKMIYLKEQSEIALLKALGFSGAQIERKYIQKIAFTALLALVCTALISMSLGDQMGRFFLSLINIHGVEFVRNPYFTYIGVPLSTLSSAIIATKIGVGEIKKMNVSAVLKEDVS